MVVKGQTWGGFRSMPVALLDQVDQMTLQVHLTDGYGYVWGNLDIFKTIAERFYPVHLHMDKAHCNSHGLMVNYRRKLAAAVFEVTFVRKGLLEV